MNSAFKYCEFNEAKKILNKCYKIDPAGGMGKNYRKRKWNYDYFYGSVITASFHPVGERDDNLDTILKSYISIASNYYDESTLKEMLGI